MLLAFLIISTAASCGRERPATPSTPRSLGQRPGGAPGASTPSGQAGPGAAAGPTAAEPDRGAAAGPKAAANGAGGRRRTYRREATGGLYLDILPGGEGEPTPGQPIERVTDDVAWEFGPQLVKDEIGDTPFRISTADGGRINRTVRIGGPNPQDFPLHADECGIDCGPEGFYCSKAVCEFGVTFSPLAVGPRTATLLIGDTGYALTGIGTPPDPDEAQTESTSSTTTPPSEATPTSSAPGSSHSTAMAASPSPSS